MGEILEIQKDIKKEVKDLKKVDEKIFLGNKEDVKKDIEKVASEVKDIIKDIQKISDAIDKIKNITEKTELQKQVQALRKDLADLRDDGDINQSNILQTQEAIGKETEALESFVKDYITRTKSRANITMGVEYKTQIIEKNNTEENRRILWGDELATFENGLKIEELSTTGDQEEIYLKITDTETIKAIENGTLKILQHPGISANSLDKCMDYNGHIYYRITIKNSSLQELADMGYIDNLHREIDIMENEDRQSGNIKMKGEQLINIIKFSQDPPEEKYNQIKGLCDNLSDKDKISFLAILADYLNGIYNSALYKEKKNIFKNTFKDKNASNEEMLSGGNAGVCADHHRLVALLATDLGFQAGVVSATGRGGLHAITWIKNGEDYILIDYGSIYKSKSPEDLMANYYATKGATPKPFDIVTDADGNIIGEISTPLGEIIGKKLSPYGEKDSSHTALGIAGNEIQTIERGNTYTVNATNINQEIEWKYGIENQKYQLLGRITNNENIGNASTTGVNIISRYQSSTKNDFSTNLAFNNTRRDNENQANSLGLGFGYTHKFKAINMGENVQLNSAIVGQLGVGFDMNKKINPDNGEKEEGGSPINWEKPQFIADMGLAISTNNIAINKDISVQGYGAIEGKILPNKIDNPVASLTIKPKVEVGAKTNISLSGDTRLTLGGNISDTRYNKGANKLGYGANAKISSRNVSLQGSIEGETHTMSEVSILTRQFMRQVEAEWTPATNVFGGQMKIFSSISGRNVNGQQKSVQTTAGMKYNF